MFKNIIISMLAAALMLQSGFIRPDNIVQAVVIPIVWYFVFVISLTWVDCRQMARKERGKNNEHS